MSADDHQQKRSQVALRPFQQGDLMYGRSAARAAAAIKMTADAFVKVADHNEKVDLRKSKIDAHAIQQGLAGPKVIAPPKIDGLPDQKRTFISTLDQFGAPETFKSLHQNRQDTGKDDLSLPEQNDFMRKNHAHPKYKRYTDALQTQIARQGGAVRASTEKSWREDASTTPESDNAVFRAKSKFGLEWALEQGHHVHFAVGDVNMHQVATKTEPGDRKDAVDPTNKYRSYTGSELRWLYRHKDDPRVQNQVHFVANDEHTGHELANVPAPWHDTTRTSTDAGGQQVSWKSAWEAYVPSKKPPSLK